MLVLFCEYGKSPCLGVLYTVVLNLNPAGEIILIFLATPHNPAKP
jgi:hypothetical protein